MPLLRGMRLGFIAPASHMGQRVLLAGKWTRPALRFIHLGVPRGSRSASAAISPAQISVEACSYSAQTQQLSLSPGEAKDREKGNRCLDPSTLHSSVSLRSKSFKSADFGFSQGKNIYTWEPSLKRSGVFMLVSHQEESLAQRLRLVGMPSGYPHSCGVGFRRYFLLSLCSSSVSSFASSIGFQSILNGFFLASSPQLWMLKDLVPALAAAYLANRIVSYENRPKFWFVVSVGMHNLSVIAEMIVPSLVPQHLLFAAVTTSCIRQSASLMFLVTRASALQHFAISNNLAELTKKFNSFGIVIYTVATALGIAFTSVVTSLTAQLITVLMCCAVNLIISHQSMCKIAFRMLNGTTISVILHEYIQNGSTCSCRRVLTPREVSDRIGLQMIDPNVRDPDNRTCLLCVSPPVYKLRVRPECLGRDVVYLCASGMFLLALWEPVSHFSTLADGGGRGKLPLLRRLFARSKTRARDARVSKLFKRRLVLLVHQDCDSMHLLTAYLVAYTALLHHAESEATLHQFLKTCGDDQATWLERGKELQDSLRFAGWDVDQLILDSPNYRVSDLSFAASRVVRTSLSNTSSHVCEP
ncbi:putative Vitamin B6 photo protection and homoeostasis [Trypanosoma vivax]|nr:putative Vitamin B6 photo protection and homoeostasis [Trypanosoma vivax]